MKAISFRSIRSTIFIIILIGLLTTNLALTAIGQKSVSGVTQNSNIRITEKVMFDSPIFENFSASPESTDARGRGPKHPPTNTPPTQWEIASQAGVKIFTNEDAWYFVSKQELENAGFDTNTNSTKWMLFVDGDEIPMSVNTDGSIEFYGNSDDTPSTDSKVYYLINGTSSGLRISESQGGSAGPNPDAENFPVKIEYKNRMFYLTGLLNGEAENWFGSIVNQNAVTFDINATNLDTVGQANLELKIQGLTYNSHLVNIKINGYDLGTVSFSDRDSHQQTFDVPISELIEGNNQITLQAIGSGSDINLLDRVSLTYPRRFKAINNKLSFSVRSGQTARVSGFSNTNVKVFEIENRKVKQQVIVDQEIINGSYGFSLAASNFDREFIAFNDSNIALPKKVERNIPSEWNLSTNQADFVIISPSNLSSYAQQLADRRTSQRLKTKVVLAEDIADEFGFGILTAEAIRSFLKHATSTWSLPPNYVLLFGDSSYDMRNYLGGENRNLISTKLIETFDMETASDGWLVDFNDDGIENIAIGRLPVGNPAEANKMIAKIIRYETQFTNVSKSAVLNADYFFETLNGELQNLLRSDVNSKRIERTTLGDALMRQQIVEEANANPTLVTYLGHGTTGVWSTGNVFGIAEAETLTNQKLSFYMLMTCLNGFTHNAGTKSLAETLVMTDNGAIASWASSGSTYTSGQIEMGQNVVSQVFPRGKKKTRIGDIVRTAKQYSNSMDAKRTWQLIGDPTLIIE